jgi:hypothetical protein
MDFDEFWQFDDDLMDIGGRNGRASISGNEDDYDYALELQPGKSIYSS